MLSKIKLQEFEALVAKEYGEGATVSSLHRSSFVRVTKKYRRNPLAEIRIADDNEQLASCCGIQELEGIEAFEHFSTLEIAVVALWLHECDPNGVAGIVCTTARSPAKRPTKQETNLRKVGFRASMRGINGNTGNLVTLWTFAFPKGK